MGFPDRIERTVHLDRPVDRVWAALTTAEGLSGWFGQRAEIDLRVGGAGTLSWDTGDVAKLRIERVEPPTVFGYTWHINGLPDDDPRRTYVEFTLTEEGAGTALTVVESGFGQLDAAEHKVAHDGNVGGWKAELDELVAYLNG